MNNQKADNALNLAMDATQEELEKSKELETGYDRVEEEWELILRYAGSLDRARQLSESVTELLAGYAIIVIKESRIPELLTLPEIEYVEKPKQLFFSIGTGKRASCITSVQQDLPVSLFGNGVLVGIIDSGIAYENPVFRNTDGSTKILRLWDQGLEGFPPEGYERGTEFKEEDINRILGLDRNGDQAEETIESLIPTRDLSGHGTAVAGIAMSISTESRMLVVRLSRPRAKGFPNTVELLLALNYLVETAVAFQRPIAINLSFGNTYGSHSGTSLVERFLDDIGNIWESVICIGSGNEGIAAGHTAGRLESGRTSRIGLSIGEYQTAFSVQLWKSYVDEVSLSFLTPTGEMLGPIQPRPGTSRYRLNGEELLVYYGEPSPYSTNQEIYMELLPATDYLESGNWQIILEAGRIVEGIYRMYLPAGIALQRDTRFLQPIPAGTFTIPSTAGGPISVAAYDSRTRQYAEFSGRGFETIMNRNMKPDLAAPGVRILAPTPEGTYMEVTGTSFATPFVTAGAALLMEWGIVQGNDRFLYGDKVKAYLRKGARTLPGFTEYPNNQVGWGALCVRDSLPL